MFMYSNIKCIVMYSNIIICITTENFFCVNGHNTNRERHWVRRCIQIKEDTSELHVENNLKNKQSIT